jgi:poly-gamma-glutamate synthesis protein (capsule biosynthesis protein)
VPDVRLAFVGDLYATARTVTACAQDATLLGAAVERLRSADLRFANLEAPLIDNGVPLFSTGVRLHSPESTVHLLRQLGIDVVSVANNHLADMGIAGVRSTLARLDEAHIASIGAGHDRKEAESPRIVEVKGRRIGFLAACDNEGGGASWHQPGVNVLAPRRLVAAVTSLRAQVDYVVVSVHTGLEFQPAPEPFFRDLAHRLIDAGAVLVVGHHPHVPQGIERHGNGLIAYSLGDFLFDMPRADDDMDARGRALNRLHPILEVDLVGGVVALHRVHLLTRDTEGRYRDAESDAAALFDGLSALLQDPPALDRAAREAYRGVFKMTVYDTPTHFARALGRGAGPLRGLLWWLSTLRREPKRRMLWCGCRAWGQRIVERLIGGQRPS